MGVLGWTFHRRAGGDGSSGRSLPVCGHPDSPHVAAAAGEGGGEAASQWGRNAGSKPRPAQSAGLPLSLPLQTGHQPQDHPHVSHMFLHIGVKKCAVVFTEKGPTSNHWQDLRHQNLPRFIRHAQPIVQRTTGLHVNG